MGGGDSDGGDPEATTGGGEVLPRGRAAPAAVADSGVWAAWAPARQPWDGSASPPPAVRGRTCHACSGRIG